jgi:KDO2-lipid IV(A) lauroyltransferase
MVGRISVFILWLLHFLPPRLLGWTGAGIGWLAFRLVRSRRDVVRVNLQLCFPDLSAEARERLARAHFRCFGRALAESGIAWWGSEERLRRTVKIEGQEHLEALRGHRVIHLAPHFVGLEFQGMRLTLDMPGAAVYVRQKDPYIDTFLKTKRERFPGTRMFARHEGIKPIVRVILNGQPMQLSPDMDLGARDAVFVPFFNVEAATVTALARLAKLTGAKVVPAVVRQLGYEEGYLIRYYPAWENYPSDDLVQDTRRMNAFIEERIREMPEQYLWTHRRFKTRPPGAASPYAPKRRKRH